MNKKLGHVENIEIPVRDNPDWKDFKFELKAIQKMTSHGVAYNRGHYRHHQSKRRQPAELLILDLSWFRDTLGQRLIGQRDIDYDGRVQLERR